MFATALHPLIRAIPSFSTKQVDWIPINIAAAAICDIVLSHSCFPIAIQSPSPPTTPVSESDGYKTDYSVHNITNPNPISWSEFVRQLRDATGTDEMTLPTVSMKEWLKRLVAVIDLPDEVPGLRLLQFFENMADAESSEKETQTHYSFETGKTQEISNALRACKEFNGEWLKDYVAAWKSMGFIN
jgi:hypothetical protein